MNDLGIKIKTLRKKYNLTQEDLAERLGVSFQSVSKWETGAVCPDIGMFPILANFFDVTTDELLGVDLSKKKERIDAVLAEYDRLSNLGKEKEKFEYISRAHRDYPNDYRILDKYLWMLCYDPNCDGNGLLVHEEEIMRLCNRVLEMCPVDGVRYTALSILSGLYRDKDDIEKALAYAERCPNPGEEIEQCYEQGTEKWWESVRANVATLTETLMVKFRNCALYAPLPPEERIQLLQKAVDLLRAVYEDGDYGFSHYHLCELYLWIANRYIELKDYKNAADYLERGLAHGRQYDALPPVTVHTSFLVRNYRFETADVYRGYEGNEVMRELSYLDENDFYNEIRGEDWFRAILDKYRPYAKEYR